MEDKRAQAWSFDLMVALVIFLATLSLLFFYSINYKGEGENVLAEMQYEGNAAADVLLSEGYPKNWNIDPNNVVVPGLLSNGRIDELKLSNFSKIDYNKQKVLLNMKYNFCLGFSVSTANCIGEYDAEAENLILISRVAVYQNKSSLVNLYIWK